MAVADTSWMIALLNPDDAHHARASGAAPKATPVMVPYAILAETLQVIVNRLAQSTSRTSAQKQARAVLRQLSEIPGLRFEATSDSQNEAATRYYTRDSRLSFFDAIAVAHAGGTELLTFDDAQRDNHADPLPS